MNDKLLMENYLLILKSTMEVYVHGTLESSNNGIRELLNTGLNETLNDQKRCYDKMTEFGWYKISNVDTKTISNTLKNINNN